MQLKAVLLSCLLAMQHCSASENQQNCLSVDQTLYQLNIDFQNELKTHFNLKKPLKNTDYKRYIEEISNRTISANFFLNKQKEKTVKSLKTTPSFKLI